MTPSFLEKIALGLSGLTALGIGTFITFAPHAFYASYGITLGDDASLLSELRAPGAGLAVFGGLMLLGIRSLTMLPVSIALALTVFIAFPAGRFIGLGVDGMPSASVIGALVVELGIAALCLAAFRRRLWQPARVHPAAQPMR
ncbi:protein of unknown function [Cribrihabitans marinus]|uniref:DUF4345 domain-containing protein n=1 Tax=Cribrihabitans marinus TaxID=1227549 RepID=A0A1H7E1D1_9RHOB|nr:DUF4345 domain-containing protein [Cribrihabitans marinus]GGH41344.1 hypothetical protein GCM10010973_38230 [Cribrihabitans marinus]SEK07504.1 protein of unknown function [Cribrihabitans marinus]